MASSRHIKDVSFCGRPQCGVIGTAPSAELLATWMSREHQLNETYRSHRVTCSQMPVELGAYVGQDLDTELLNDIKTTGARTKPARETGGNIDAASLTRGARICLPVYVEGANLSIGDLHFSLGDGEPTCAIGMAGIATFRCSVLKRGITRLCLKIPIVIPSPAEPLYRKQVVFHGLSVDKNGVQHRSDLTTSYIQAASHAMEYLERFGFSQEQAYMLLATAPIESRILATANVPTANVSLGIPVEIFDFDILPSEERPESRDRGRVAYLSPEREAKFLSSRVKLPSPFDRDP